MKKFVSILICWLVLLASPVVVLAHPGHGSGDGFSVIHYLKEPEHIVWLALLVVGIGYLYLRARKKSSK